MSKIEKISNTIFKPLNYEMLERILGGAEPRTMIRCTTATSNGTPCGDSQVHITYDGSWSGESTEVFDNPCV